jgi:hypothetical protein
LSFWACLLFLFACLLAYLAVLVCFLFDFWLACLFACSFLYLLCVCLCP